MILKNNSQVLRGKSLHPPAAGRSSYRSNRWNSPQQLFHPKTFPLVVGGNDYQKFEEFLNCSLAFFPPLWDHPTSTICPWCSDYPFYNYPRGKVLSLDLKDLPSDLEVVFSVVSNSHFIWLPKWIVVESSTNWKLQILAPFYNDSRSH